MAKLTYSEYKNLPMSSFASKKVISEDESKRMGISPKNLRREGGKLYHVQLPIKIPGDKASTESHARNALARVNQAKGITDKQQKVVERKADKKLDISPSDRRVMDLKKRQQTL